MNSRRNKYQETLTSEIGNSERGSPEITDSSRVLHKIGQVLLRKLASGDIGAISMYKDREDNISFDVSPPRRDN
jgi:hypothetical protein